MSMARLMIWFCWVIWACIYGKHFAEYSFLIILSRMFSDCYFQCQNNGLAHSLYPLCISSIGHQNF